MPLAAADSLDRRVSVLARLKQGTTWTGAAAELDALARPQNPNGLWTWSAVPVSEDVNRSAVGGFAMMFGPALVILLIGCTNVACMLIARGVERDIELSVRSALGATRWRIVRHLLEEYLALALAGGGLGVALAYALLKAIAAAIWAKEEMARPDDTDGNMAGRRPANRTPNLGHGFQCQLDR